MVDEDHAIAEAYGVWGEKSMYGRKYMGIIRSHFVIDEKGKIADAQVKVSPTDSVKLALEKLARLGASHEKSGTGAHPSTRPLMTAPKKAPPHEGPTQGERLKGLTIAYPTARTE